MNAAQHNMPPDARDDEARSALSALVDGELSERAYLAWCEDTPDAEDSHAQWLGYQLISEVLRGSKPTVSGRSAQDFLEAVRTGLPPAASTGSLQSPVAQIAHVRAPAANDPVLRWKLVAGVASLAAVMAVSWGVLRGVPGAVAPGATGVVLASNVSVSALSAPVAALPEQAATPVVVNTAQGTLIRDERLERLLAEHRQYGGMSALQMPAGFLRNATYESGEGR